MKKAITDIDIDVPNRKKVLELFRHVPACRNENKCVMPHNTGVYFHAMPANPLTGLATLDYKDAEQAGYFKIDILNVNIYTDVKNNQHMNALLEKEPEWELLEQEDFCNMVFHLHGHHDVCQAMKPKTVLQLAAVLAMIRPAKKHLIGKTWSTVMNEIWKKPDNDQYYFKKSHAVGYAMAVKLHMNLLAEKIMESSE